MCRLLVGTSGCKPDATPHSAAGGEGTLFVCILGLRHERLQSTPHSTDPNAFVKAFVSASVLL
jgi:hypothetical protein